MTSFIKKNHNFVWILCALAHSIIIQRYECAVVIQTGRHVCLLLNFVNSNIFKSDWQSNNDRKLEKKFLQCNGSAKQLKCNVSMQTIPRSGGNSTEFGAGDLCSAAIGPRRCVGVHGCCFTGIVFSISVSKRSFDLYANCVDMLVL